MSLTQMPMWEKDWRATRDGSARASSRSGVLGQLRPAGARAPAGRLDHPGLQRVAGRVGRDAVHGDLACIEIDVAARRDVARPAQHGRPLALVPGRAPRVHSRTPRGSASDRSSSSGAVRRGPSTVHSTASAAVAFQPPARTAAAGRGDRDRIRERLSVSDMRERDQRDRPWRARSWRCGRRASPEESAPRRR